MVINFVDIPRIDYLAELGEETPAPYSMGTNAVRTADLVYWLCTIPRLNRIAKLAGYFRQQEMAIQVDMRKVSTLMRQTISRPHKSVPRGNRSPCEARVECGGNCAGAHAC